MYDIRQFKPALYLVLILGVTGFAMAAESAGLWGFCVLAIGVNAWLVRSGRFAPLPYWLANISTVLALLYIFFQIRAGGGPPLMFIGQFLLLLQLIKLFEQRNNRDYVQMLVVSFLLMVAAAINTASLVFGVIMLAYLVVALYCCLLFHLKVEAERARAAFPVPPERISPAILQQDQRHLGGSMRRLTGLVSVAALVGAVVIFLGFPRGAGQGVLGQLQFRNPGALTGFSERVEFDQINRIQQNDEVVAHVKVWRGDRLVQGTEPLMLRGFTLDVYGPSGRSRGYRWNRSRQLMEEPRELPDGSEMRTNLVSPDEPYTQHVLLRPSDTRYLFALPGILSFKAARQLAIRYSPSDESLQVDQSNLPLDYTVVSTNSPARTDTIRALTMQVLMASPRSDPAVLAPIREYTLRDEVTDGLAAKRTRIYPLSDLNEEIARKIEYHLKTRFSYTLDLTDVRDEMRRGEPVLNFLTKVKRGHCEYFASAMTLMCQSIGIPARMVVGFRCDEYNVVGGYYIVRQAHAHTWVEVATPRGWVSFDPTSGRDETAAGAASVWQSIKHFFDFLEYKWAEKVVAYDTSDRDDILHSLDAAMTQTAVNSSGVMARIREWFSDPVEHSEFWSGFYKAWFNVLTLMVMLMIAGIVASIIGYLIQRHRLRNRAHRIGIDALPHGDQIRLARQLAFYDQLTRALQRHRIQRPQHMTPMEFAQSLVFLPGEAHDAIRRLTGMFYRVRFGRTRLNAHRQRRLETVVGRLGEELARTMPRQRLLRR